MISFSLSLTLPWSLPFSLRPFLSSSASSLSLCPCRLLYLAQILRATDTTWRHSIPQSPPHNPPLQSHTNQPSEWTPLVFIIKISIGSKPWYVLQYAAGNAGDIYEKSPKRKPNDFYESSPLFLSSVRVIFVNVHCLYVRTSQAKSVCDHYH